MSVISPNLPVATGPYNLTQPVKGPGGSSVTVVSKATLGRSVAAPLTQLSLTFNGASGFPVPPQPGSYEARGQMTLPTGPEVFCFELTVNNVAFVTATPVPVPALPSYWLPALPLLVAGAGLLVVRRGRST